MLKRFTRGLGTTLRNAEVTICIPTWQAAQFIDRTLHRARLQSHRRIRILVSIDYSNDATADICKAHARVDPRIEVFTHRQRLGWTGNVNFLLDRVATEFYFVYFHDDLIERDYTSKLLSTFQRRPDATTAYCDMGHFGGSDHLSIGRSYDGPAPERLTTYLFSEEKGSPLRGLTRSEVLDAGLRLPTKAEGGLWANQPFLLALIAAGPCLRVPKVLYHRWDQRSGGLTDLWTRHSFQQVVAGFRTNIDICFDILDGVESTEVEKALLTFGLYIYMMPKIRRAEQNFGITTPLQPEELHPRFRDMGVPDALSVLEPRIRQWAIESYRQATQTNADLTASAAPQRHPTSHGTQLMRKRRRETNS